MGRSSFGPSSTARWTQSCSRMTAVASSMPTRPRWKREPQQLPRMVGSVQDVTDRHLALDALRASEAEFRLLAEAMPQIVWITQPDGRNVYFNQQWVNYTGLTLEESHGDGWNKPFHPDDKPAAWAAWQNATATAGTYAIESRLQRADGVYRWWLIRGIAVRDASGKVLKWFGTCTDIDDLKQSEARLRDSEALLRIAGHAARLGGWRVSVHNLELKCSDGVGPPSRSTSRERTASRPQRR